MSDEEKVETAETETEADAPKGAEGEEAPLQVDYKAVAEAETARREAAERLLAEDRYNASKHKREEEEIIPDELPLTAKDLQELEARIVRRTQKETQEIQALAIARANTSSEEEAQAALLFWKNRIVPTGNLEDDVKFAIGGLNQKTILAKNNELARALKAKENVSSDTLSTQRDGLPTTEPKLSKDSPLRAYKYLGNNIYSKKLANGKTLFRNAKPGPGQPKNWVE